MNHLDEAQNTFANELPNLLKTHEGQWVAYHGSQRLGFGPSKTALRKKCEGKGIPFNELYIRKIQPEMGVAQKTW